MSSAKWFVHGLAALILAMAAVACTSARPGTPEGDLDAIRAGWEASRPLVDADSVQIVDDRIGLCVNDVGPQKVSAGFSALFRTAALGPNVDAKEFAVRWESALESATGADLAVSTEQLESGPQFKAESNGLNFLLAPDGEGGYSFGGGGPCR
jgi:hypothetical protein